MRFLDQSKSRGIPVWACVKSQLPHGKSVISIFASFCARHVLFILRKTPLECQTSHPSIDTKDVEYCKVPSVYHHIAYKAHTCQNDFAVETNPNKCRNAILETNPKAGRNQTRCPSVGYCRQPTKEIDETGGSQESIVATEWNLHELLREKANLDERSGL